MLEQSVSSGIPYFPDRSVFLIQRLDDESPTFLTFHLSLWWRVYNPRGLPSVWYFIISEAARGSLVTIISIYGNVAFLVEVFNHIHIRCTKY